MKFAFLSLLLLNGFFLLWQNYFGEPAQPAGLVQSADTPELVLLEETGTTVAVEPPAPEPAIEVSENTDGEFLASARPFVSIRRRCYSVGPFVDEAILSTYQRFLAERELSFNVRTLSERELFGYNVILPPFPDRAAAEAMVTVLLDKGITDYYIMPDPELRHAISLGLFKEHRFATRHKAFLEKKGLEPVMHSRYRERSRHWLDYTATGDALDESALIALAPGSDLQRLPRACSSG